MGFSDLEAALLLYVNICGKIYAGHGAKSSVCYGGFGATNAKPPAKNRRGQRGSRTLAVVALQGDCVSTSPSARVPGVGLEPTGLETALDKQLLAQIVYETVARSGALTRHERKIGQPYFYRVGAALLLFHYPSVNLLTLTLVRTLMVAATAANQSSKSSSVSHMPSAGSISSKSNKSL